MNASKLSVDAYFELPETSRPMELLYGVVREPPAPFYPHQAVVTRLTALLDRHVHRFGLGRVCVSPVDVVFDKDAALVLQPDLIFVSAERLHIIKDRVWGAPDLTIEVLSPRTAERDRTQKLGWYRHYGVQESWLVDPQASTVEVCDLSNAGSSVMFEGSSQIRSRVLPRLRLRTRSVFEP